MQLRLKGYVGRDRWALIEGDRVELVTEDPTNRGPLTSGFDLSREELETILTAMNEDQS